MLAIGRFDRFFNKQKDEALRSFESRRDALIRSSVWAILSVLLFSLVISLKFSKEMILSFSSLVNMSNTIRKGDYKTHALSKDLQKSSISEVQNLAQNIKDMAGDLNKSFSNLERSNAELQNFAFIASHDLKEPIKKDHKLC